MNVNVDNARSALSSNDNVILKTVGLDGCQATVLYAEQENNKAALLAHVSPRHYYSLADSCSVNGATWANSVTSALRQQPLLRRPQHIVMYYDSDCGSPQFPTIQNLQHLRVETENAQITAFGYSASARNQKKVKVVLPAAIESHAYCVLSDSLRNILHQEHFGNT